MENEKIPSYQNSGSQNAFILFLIILIGILAASTTYFFSKSTTKTTQPEKKEPATQETTESPQPTTEQPAQATPQTSSTSSSNRLSQVAKTHLVLEGETLFPIGSKYEIEWTLIATANGLVDPYVIKAGETLIIPEYDQNQKVPYISYTYQQNKATEFQTQSETEKGAFRKDPVAVAKLEAPNAFGLKDPDTYNLKSKDDQKGEAFVIGSTEGKNYQIKLSQPQTKGSQGIWVISEIRPSK